MLCRNKIICLTLLLFAHKKYLLCIFILKILKCLLFLLFYVLFPFTVQALQKASMMRSPFSSSLISAAAAATAALMTISSFGDFVNAQTSCDQYKSQTTCNVVGQCGWCVGGNSGNCCVASTQSGSSCICPQDRDAILSVGAIVGIALGCVFFLLILVLLIRCCLCIPGDEVVVQRDIIIVKQGESTHHNKRNNA